MGDLKSNEGMNKFVGVLQKRTKQISDKPSGIDVGEIQEDMSLLCNKFPLPIPQSDYMVCRSVCLGEIDDILYRTQEVGKDNSGYHQHTYEDGAHEHKVTVSCAGCSPPDKLSGTTDSCEDSEDLESHDHDFDISCGGCSTPSDLSGNTDHSGNHGHYDNTRNMEHVHDMLIGEKMRWLIPGDRVLVVWIDGSDPCVVDLIFPATALEREANSYEMIAEEIAQE